MSVVPMKLLTVAGPLARFDDVMASCVIDQEFHPENALQLMKKVSGLRPLSFTNPYTPLLRRVEEVISLTTEDTVNARVQLPDGSYELQDRRGRPVLNCQTELAARARRALQQKEKNINEGLI